MQGTHGAGLEACGNHGVEQRIESEDTVAPKKDLPAKKNPKGGAWGKNDNLTLVRAAKPAKKDLPAGKDVKGGKKTTGGAGN